MRILFVSKYFDEGGAGVAASRLYKALSLNTTWSFRFLSLIGIKRESFNVVVLDKHVQFYIKLKEFTVRKLKDLFFPGYPFVCLGALPSSVSYKINKSNYDIVHLHWLGGESFSFQDISRLKAKVIWTVHDSWIINGLSYYEVDDTLFGYGCFRQALLKFINTGLKRTKGHFLNKLDLTIVSPSNWLKQEILNSGMYINCKIYTIPNPVDEFFFQEQSRIEAKRAFNLELDQFVIIFGAVGIDKDKRKGLEYICEILRFLEIAPEAKSIQVLFFGANQPLNFPTFKLNIQWLGFINSQDVMRLLYAAADIMVVTSLFENLPQTATESLAVGTPVAAFNVGGLSDCIVNNYNGFLIPPFDCELMSEKIIDYMQMGTHYRQNYVENSRAFARSNFHPEIVVRQYLNIYSS